MNDDGTDGACEAEGPDAIELDDVTAGDEGTPHNAGVRVSLVLIEMPTVTP